MLRVKKKFPAISLGKKMPTPSPQSRLKAAIREFAHGLSLLVPRHSKKLVLNTIASACKRQISWQDLFAFLRTFVNDAHEAKRLCKKFADDVHRESVALKIEHRKFATGSSEACTVCVSFQATEPCELCGQIATCCGCEGLCRRCDKEYDHDE